MFEKSLWIYELKILLFCMDWDMFFVSIKNIVLKNVQHYCKFAPFYFASFFKTILTKHVQLIVKVNIPVFEIDQNSPILMKIH